MDVSRQIFQEGSEMIARAFRTVPNFVREQERIAVKRAAIKEKWSEIRAARNKASAAGLSEDEYRSLLKQKPELANLDAGELSNYISDYGVDATVSKTKSLEQIMFEKKKGMSKAQAYQVDQVNREIANDMELLKNVGARQEVAKRYGIEEAENISDRKLHSVIRDHYAEKLAKGPTAMDRMMAYKVPQAATGALITAGLVNALSNGRGRQTNAQLYGQAPMPGMG